MTCVQDGHLVHGVGSERVAAGRLPQQVHHWLRQSNHLQKWHNVHTSVFKGNKKQERFLNKKNKDAQVPIPVCGIGTDTGAENFTWRQYQFSCRCI